MFYGTGAEPGEHDFDPNAVEPPWGPRRRAIGNIHTIVGSFTVARAGAAVVQLAVGDPVFEGDIVETGADSSVSIHFSDGTVFELSACARMVLSEFAGDGASSSAALFVLSKGAIAFMAGRAAKGGLWIDTPIARIRGSRGGGIVSLAVAALAFAALKEVRADDQPIIDDERVELPHGTFELVTKELVPQVIVVDDPWKTVVLQKVGSTVDVDRVANSFERMDDLGQISRDTFAIFRQGQQDPYINHQQRAAVGTGETRADLSISDFSDVPVVTPANLISPDSDPEFDVVPTNFAPASSFIPEVPIVIPTTIVSSPTIVSTPATIILAAAAQLTFIDTSAPDDFDPVTGTLLVTATNTNAPLTFGIAGGTTDLSFSGYNQSLTVAYGTLYLSSTTGDYAFIPNDTTINALTAPTAANFTLMASDGTLSTQQTVAFALDGANDAPTLQPVTGPTYTDASAAQASSAASLELAVTNTSEPGVFTAVTGTLVAADVDLPAQTLTYGIVGGTTGGSTVLDEVTYDVSKTGAYGTLYVNSATGDYTFVPNETAIKALSAVSKTEEFTVTVSDGSLSAQRAFAVTVNGVNDQTVLTSVNSTAVSTTVPESADDSSAQDIAAIHGSLSFTDEDIGDNLTASASLSSVLINGNPLSSAAANALTIALDHLSLGAGVISTGGTQTISWTWDPATANLDFLKVGDQLTITYAVHVGDSAPQNLVFTINGTNDAPVITSGPAAAAVSEESLTTGVPDNLPDGLDTTNSATANGTITATDADGDPLHMTLGIPTEPLTSGGVTIAWTPEDDGHTLVGKAGATTIITATITDAGAYTVTLSGPIDHPNTNQEDNRTFVVPVAVSDGTTSTATTLSVTVEDDSPKATQVDVSISSTGSMTNVMLILDLSGSMAGSRLTAAKAAVNELLKQYDDRGDVKVQIVTFSDTATAHSSTWMNVTEAKTVVAGLSAGGFTNYDDALLTAMEAFAYPGKLTGSSTQNVSYFISDGDPTANIDWPADIDGPLTGLDPILEENGIQLSEQSAWESFLTANNIVSFALGIPNVSTPEKLNPIAFDPESGTQPADTSIIVTNLSQLTNALVITIPPLTASVLTGAGGTASNSFGGDGGFVKSITVDNVTYTFNPTLNSITTSGGAGSFSYNATTKKLTVDTDTNAVGGEFVMEMTTGAFTFQPPTNFNAETIDYVLADNDGDTAGSTLHFSVASAQLPAGIAGEPINLALTDPSGNQVTPINVTVSGLPSGWTLNEGTRLDDGSWTLQTTDVESLTVTTSPDFVGAAVLTVTETWTNPDGTTGAKIIADNVEAYAPGSPIFAWSGDDTLTGSSGSDLFVFAQPIGYDVIYSFDASHDQIDLIGYAGIASFDDVKSHLTADANGDAVITLADGQSITLDGVAADSLAASNFVFDQTPVVNNAGAMTIGDGALLPLSGVIDNTGTIALGSTGHATTLELIQHGVTLQGGGQLVLSDSDANLIVSAAPGVTFTNADNTISGAGQLGDWQMTLVNNGTIVATGAHALIIDTGSNVVINTGTLEATGSGGLVVDSDIANTGLIWAHGGDITVNGSVSGAGSALLTGSATLEFAAAASINVTFVGADDFGTLVLDNPTGYTGQIFGFTGTGLENSDIINLKGITFDDRTSWTYYDDTGSNTGGTLTIYDTVNGVTTAVDSLTFGDGEYTTANFILTSDGNGGTLIADPPADFGTGTETLGTSNADPVHNQASDSFAFNSAFSENGTGGSETAQIVEQSDQTALQTVSDTFADAAASLATSVPIGEGVATITGVEHDKLSTDFLLHG